jgi:sigma-E factor negative regulatory protein RseB
LNGPHHEITQSDGEVTAVISKDPHSVLAAHRPGEPVAAAADFAATLDGVYTLAEHGDDRVAGRASSVIEIQPRDAFRNGFQLWLDKETGLVLRSDMRSPAGDTIEQIMFTAIDYLDTERATAVLGVTDATPETAARDNSRDALAAAERGKSSRWRFDRIPAGFVLAEHYAKPTAEGAAPFEQLVLSDGLAAVSIFIEPQDEHHRSFLGSARIGAVSAYGLTRNNHQVTVVGEVPAATVRLIGDALRYDSSD